MKRPTAKTVKKIIERARERVAAGAWFSTMFAAYLAGTAGESAIVVFVPDGDFFPTHSMAVAVGPEKMVHPAAEVNGTRLQRGTNILVAPVVASIVCPLGSSFSVRVKFKKKCTVSLVVHGRTRRPAGSPKLVLYGPPPAKSGGVK